MGSVPMPTWAPKLTLNFGVRYDLQFLETIHTDRNNIAPRVGFAWSPSDARSTVVRGSAGLFYDRVPLRALANALLSANNTTDLAELQQINVGLSPAQAGLAMVPTSVAGFVANLTLLPRALKSLGPLRSMVAGLGILAVGQLWIAYAPPGLGYGAAVLPGLLLVAVGVAFSFTPTTMVIAAAAPATHTGLAAGLASSATQVGAALGTATFTAIALAAGGGFTAAFTVAALVALTTAAFASVLVRRGSVTA